MFSSTLRRVAWLGRTSGTTLELSSLSFPLRSLALLTFARWDFCAPGRMAASAGYSAASELATDGGSGPNLSQIDAL